MKTTFHILILDGCVAAVGGFLHRQNDTAEQMRTQTHRLSHTHTHTPTTVRFTTVWTVTHTVFLSEIKDTHTAACVTQHHTDRICKTEPPPCSRGGGGCRLYSTWGRWGWGSLRTPTPPAPCLWTQRGPAPAPHTFSCNRRHTDKRHTDGCRSNNTGHRHEVNDPQ